MRPLPSTLAALLALTVPTAALQEAPSPAQRFDRALRFSTAVHGGTVQPHWLPHEEGFWFTRLGDGVRTVERVTPDGRAPLFDVVRLRAALEEATGRAPRGEGVPFSAFTLGEDGRAVHFEQRGKAWRLELADYSVTEEPKPSSDERRRREPRNLRPGFTAGQPALTEVQSPDGARFLGDDERNLTLRTDAEAEGRALTEDGEEDHAWTCRGARWSPDGRRVAVLRVDTRGVDRLPVVDWLQPQVEEVELHPYTKAGRPMPRTELCVIDVESGERVALEGTGLVDHYVNLMGWTEDGREVAFQRMDRRYRRLDVVLCDARTGAARTALTETSETFIGALYYMTDWQHLLTPLGDDERILWISERDGWRHLYLYGRDGTLLQRLTSGEWEVERVVGVDLEGGWVYFLGHAEPDPYETHLYRVDLEGRGFARLTEGAGEHAPELSPSRRTFLDVWSSPTAPPRSEYRRADGTLLRAVEQAEVEGLSETGWQAPRPFVVKAADGETDLHGLLFLPPGFDPGRAYPVLDYIYNGPFTKWVPRTFLDGRGALAQAHAALGFVVLIVDGRGTIGRGKAFQDVVHRAWGRNEIPDHAAALRQLAAARPWMDTGRVGIFGGSWGGYMTLRAMLTHPDVYHAGVATAAVADLIDHASVPIEGYMGLPEEEPEGYEYASNLRLADQLQGALLLVHGTADVNATYSACMKMTSALVRAGQQHRLVVLPGNDHAMQGAGGAYYLTAQREFLVEHLQPERVVPARD